MNSDKMEPNEPVALVTTRNGVWDDPTERAIASAVQKRDAEWRAAVERVRGTIPRESDEFERALAAIGDAVLNNVLAAMEGR